MQGLVSGAALLPPTTGLCSCEQSWSFVTYAFTVSCYNERAILKNVTLTEYRAINVSSIVIVQFLYLSNSRHARSAQQRSELLSHYWAVEMRHDLSTQRTLRASHHCHNKQLLAPVMKASGESNKMGRRRTRLRPSYS